MHKHLCEYWDKVSDCQRDHNIADCQNDEDCTLPKIFSVCKNPHCRTMAELDRYKLALEEAKTDAIKAKQLNTQFRVLMLGPAQAEKFLEDGTLSLAGIQYQINRQKPSWDTFGVELGLFFADYHQKYADAWSEFCREKSSRINIKEEVKQRVKKEGQLAAEAPAARTMARTKYDKAVATYLKLGLKQEEAEKIVRDSLGLKKE